MCLGIDDEGGPKRCSADARGRAEAARCAVLDQQAVVDSLDTQAQNIDLDIHDLHAAMFGELTPEQEESMLRKARGETEPSGVDTEEPDDNGGSEQDSPAACPDSDQPAPTWHGQVEAAVRDVDDAWARYQSAHLATVGDHPEGTVLSFGPGGNASSREQFEQTLRERQHAREAAAEAAAVYEQKVQAVGALLSARADDVIAERLGDAPPEQAGVSEADVRESGDAVDAFKRRNRGRPIAEWAPEYNQQVVEHNNLVRQRREQIAQISPRDRIRADAYRDVIGEVRPLGGVDPAVTGRPHKETRAQLRDAARYIPGEWVSTIDQAHGPVSIKLARNKRGHYVPNEELIRTSGSAATMHHEYAHRMEARLPQISVATNRFLERRTTGQDGTRDPLRRYAGGRADEKLRADGFANAYMGKEYGDDSTEIFSTGTEALFTGRHGGLVGAGNDQNGAPISRDDEHRNLILGLYATVLRKDPQ